VSEPESLPTDLAERGQKVGLGSLFALGVNGIVGVGIFFTPSAIAALVPGAAGAFTYLLTALLLSPVALTAALLGRHLAVNGGPYVWARAAFGPSAGWIVGWVAAVSAVLSTAAVFSGLGTQLSASFGPGWGSAPFAFGCATLLAAIAVFGLRPSAWVWNALTAIKLVPLLLLLALAFVPASPSAPGAQHASQAAPEWGRALLVALFPLQGFEVVPVLAGSARRGHNTVPLATLGALCFAGLLYAAIQLVCVRAVPELGLAKAPLAEAALALGGAGPSRWVALGANVSALGIAFGMVVMTPRYLSALGAHAPRFAFLARSSARDVPHYALLLMLVAVILLSSLESLESLFVLSSSAVLVQYVAASASLIRLSLRREHGFSAVASVPALLTLGAAFLLSLAIDLRELLLLGGLLGVGVLVLLARPRERR
jgi:amino acid transporter